MPEEHQEPQSPGARLRAARQSRGLALAQMAELIGCTKGWLSQLETGKQRTVGLSIAFAIERETGIAAREWDPERIAS